MKWKSGDETVERGYKFTYDSMSRITSANYGEGSAITGNPGRFNETVTYHDNMGNIGTLQRRGKLDGVDNYGLIDNLTFSYTGNQLKKVTDAVTTPVTYEGAFHFTDRVNEPREYLYDKNGNLTKDSNKNITSIKYNSLNLPEVITFNDGKTVTYGYDASGTKLSVAYKSGTTTTKMEYGGNKVYNNGTLSMLLTEEGYIIPGTTPTYHYYLKDHQGNNRVVVNQGGTVQQVNHYYPFGGLFGEGLQNSNQRYKYNGKEIDRSFALDMYDYGARHYDATLGVWTTPDPMLEKYFSISPYVYVANNPINFIDPDGKNPIIGALVGGVMDYGIQVATNYMTGKTGTDAWTDVDMKSIAVSAVSGAAGVGLASKVSQVAKLANLGKAATQVAKVAGEAVVDAGISAGDQLVTKGEISLEQVAMDTGAGVIGGKLGGEVKASKQASSEGRILARQADRAQRVARGDNPRQSRVEAARKATQRAENYGSKQAAATSVATSTVISKRGEIIKDKLKQKNQ